MYKVWLVIRDPEGKIIKEESFPNYPDPAAAQAHRDNLYKKYIKENNYFSVWVEKQKK